mmetsp:Transcript_57630/g.140771  ORF Transcript_57630/g.140771 Transcript_57630/m.140771 type:complete len:615 (-) Transcript_57630:520-2364(-)
MSRHRFVRNLVEDDYDDYYDDDYYDEDDYEEYDDTYTAPKSNNQPKTSNNSNKNNQKPNITQKQSTPSTDANGNNASVGPSSTKTVAAAGVAVPGKTAVTASVGVVSPPPGWGKPSTSGDTSKSEASSKPGITKPPPGWGSPSRAPTASETTTATTKVAKSQPTQSQKKQQLRQQQAVPYKPRPIPDFLQNTKSQLSMVVLGHVDAGKSTLMGQILLTSGQISKREATKMGNLAHFLDENESERTRGVTMEIGTKTLRTTKHDFVLLDAPGHADFVPVMITGAAAADVAVLVIAAVTGEFEAGWFGGGQTKEHVMLARGLGVSQVIVAVNKLDVEGWNQDRFNDIQSQVKDFLLQQDFKPKRIRFVPISGLTGENVLEQSDPTLKEWYSGPTLLQAIDDFQPANRQLEKPLRFIVNDVFPEGKGVVARGRVVQGFVQVGDKVVVLPVGDAVSVQKLEHLQPPSDSAEKGRLQVGIAGETVDLVFDGRELDIARLSTGNVLSFPDGRPPLTKKCLVRIMVMDELAVPIIRGAQVLFHMHSLDIPCVMTKLVSTLNRDGTVKKERPRSLPPGSNAVVELTLSDRIVMEKYSDCRALGRFVLRRGGDTVAIGLIDEV